MDGLLLFLLALLLLWWLWRISGKQQSPLCLPFVGHLYLFKMGPPYLVLANLSQRYGPLMFLRFGSTPVVVVSNKECAKEFLKTHDASFASRPVSATGNLLTLNADLVFAPYGERWRKLRRLCTLELFTSRRIESFRGVRMEEVRALVKEIHDISRKDSTSTVDLRTKLSEFTFNIITRMMMSKRYFGQNVEESREAAEFIHVIDEMFTVIGEIPVGDFVPYLRWMDLGNVEGRLKKLSKATDKFFEGIISQRQQKMKEETTSMDFLDVLLSLREKGDEVLQGEGIRGLMVNVITAGTDTSATTIEWAMAELINHPQCMAKARDEIRNLIGSERLVEESDISELPYLHAIVKEIFRLHAPVPLLLPHSSVEPCKVMGNDIASGTMLLVNVYAIGRDSSIWENPLEFKPERFLGSEVDVRGHDFEVLPFGSGRRMCPGIQLALTTVHLTLANLVHAFEWRMPVGKECIDTHTGNYGLTLLIANKLEPISRPILDQAAYK